MVDHTYMLKGAISPLISKGHQPRSDIRTANCGKSSGINILVLLACVLLASGHGEMSQAKIEKACHFKLGPPGLANPHMPSYGYSHIFTQKGVRTELTHHTVESQRGHHS